MKYSADVYYDDRESEIIQCDEYDFNNNTWEMIKTEISPPPLAKHSTAYDPNTGMIYLFGGSREVIYSDDHISFEFWSYDPINHIWSDLNVVK
jgi:N-acetylneuraminic acid mutarotase